MTTHVERSIEVNVPVRTAYDQWTQFEDFPRFMGGVQQVRQVGDTLTHWVAEIAGVRREWDAEITEQVPEQKVAWAATTGATNAGAVYFDAVGAERTRVRLTLDYEPEGFVEKIGDVLDVVERQAVADLDRFKQYIESRGSATGGWRGTVHEGDAVSAAAGAGVAGVPDDVTPGAGTAGARDVTRSGEAEVPGDAERTGAAAGAATSAGVTGFGTDTGLASSPTSGVLTGDPGARSASEADTAEDDAERTGAAAGAATSAGVTGFGTDTGLSSSPTSGVLTGDPGARATSHAGSGTGDLVGEVGANRAGWTDQPGARDDVTEAATDPVGEDWAREPGAGSTTTSRRGDESADDGLTGASTDPVGEDWDAGAGSRSATTGTDEQWTAAGGGPGEDQAQVTGGEGVVQRDFADKNLTTDDVVARDFANRDVTGEGVVERDFANRDITERDIANRGIEDPGIEDRRLVTGMGGAHVAPNPQPTTLDAADAPGPADEIGAGLDPVDPRTGTADDPDNPIRPSV